MLQLSKQARGALFSAGIDLTKRGGLRKPELAKDQVVFMQRNRLAAENMGEQFF